jgi:PAS domain S-box-containing protein
MATKGSKGTRLDLAAENEQLRTRLAEAEETIRALGTGEVDAFVIHDQDGPRVFTLQGAEHAYRVIVETMNEGALTASQNGTVLYGNSALSRMLGAPLPNVMGRPLRDLVIEEYQPQLAALLAQARTGPARERLVLRTGGGGALPAYFSTAILPREGEEHHICMVLTDLTELEAAAARLQDSRERSRILAASEERFRLYAEAVPNIVWTTDPAGAVDYYNQRWAELTGMPVSAGYESGWEPIIHPDDRERTLTAWQQAVADGSFYQVEHRLRQADGNYRWHLSRALPLRDEQGRISRWYGTSTDIDEQKRTAEALRESQERLRLATDAASIGIWSWDPRKNEIVCTRECKEVIGFLPESRLDMQAVLRAVHPEDRSKLDQALQNILRTGEDYHLEFRVNQPQGGCRWLQMRGKVFLDDHALPGHLHGVVMDVTEARQRQEELQGLTEQLARSNQELKEFAYIASHDLQEPLRVISGFLDLLKRRYRGQLDSQADEFIDYAVNGATRMHNLIRDLLSYTRVGSSEINLRSVSIERAVDQAMANLQMRIDETGAKILRMPLPVVLGDQTMLIQLFQNLIGNALKFHGPRPPDITIAVDTRQDEWLFSVQDKGIGLEPRQADRIFKIFQRLHSADAYQGTGIGLAICKKIVEKHGGKIWVESQPGAGATFFFTLPRRLAEGERQ